jgi:hypothetical protein
LWYRYNVIHVEIAQAVSEPGFDRAGGFGGGLPQGSPEFKYAATGSAAGLRDGTAGGARSIGRDVRRG